ncbi:MAG TPA: universal stress protein [Polyangiaceae bacterium]|nr:universal stress protein [Polyangiaceae bacterium]
MLTIRRILVPVDFSSGSRGALQRAIAFAQKFGARIQVLHVWTSPSAVRPDLMAWMEGSGERPVAEIIEQQARQDLEQLVQSVTADARQLIDARLEAGDPVTTIVDIANSEGFDLLVLGTHGRSGLSHLLLGSVAEKVVRAAPCPVLTVRLAEAA